MRGMSRKVCGAVLTVLVFLALGGCAVLPENAGNSRPGLDVPPFSGVPSSNAPLQEHDRPANSSDAAEDAAEDAEKPEVGLYHSIQELQFLEDERYTDRAFRVVDEILGHPRCPPQPFQCSLIDLTQDGVPELLFHDQSGEWGGACQIFELSGNSPRYLGGIGWPIKVLAIYAKETDTGTEWMVEGSFSHGFYDHISHCILRCPDGELDVLDCVQETSLKDGFEPYETCFSVRHNGVLQEEARFSCEKFSEEEISGQMAGSLYNRCVQDGWTADDISWVFEIELYDDFSLICLKREPENLKSRIGLLYEEWLQRQG